MIFNYFFSNLLFLNSLALEFEKHIEPNILYGVATSSHQIEGGWNQDGAGLNIWSKYEHDHPENIKDHSNADVSCDSYNNLKRDFDMLDYLGVDFYRFSISWSRILPYGFDNETNQFGVNYYNDLINGLIKRNIIPVVTIYHWDLPQVLQILGGWTNDKIIDYFEDYARILFKNFGDRVKYWVTINEPYQICYDGYGSDKNAPKEIVPGFGEYLCVHNLLKAHARVYHLYKNEFQHKFKAKLGLSMQYANYLPVENTQENIEFVKNLLTMKNGWIIHPIYTKIGDYPQILKDQIRRKSKLNNLTRSRLPEFTKDEVKYIRQTADFLGINYYNGHLARKATNPNNEASFENDLDYEKFYDPKWENTSLVWIKNTPEIFYKALINIKEEYGNPLIFITENGCASEKGKLDNEQTVRFLDGHINSVRQAIKDGSNIIAYSVWTLMDNFEWSNGYTVNFGLFQMDYNSFNKNATPRDSAKFYKKFLEKVREERVTNYSNSNSVATKSINLLILVLLLFCLNYILMDL